MTGDRVLKKGDPVAVVRYPPGTRFIVYGRVLDLDGGKCLYVTPAGSKMESGLCWVKSVQPGSDDEKLLKAWEDLESDDGDPLYGGLLKEEKEIELPDFLQFYA